MPYITSTMSSAIAYCFYKTLPGGMRAVEREVLVKGGANVADKRTILTPKGVSTEVTEEELELLKKHPLFKEHLQKGFVTVVDTKYREEAEKAARSLEKKDASAPKTPDDYKQKTTKVKK